MSLLGLMLGAGFLFASFYLWKLARKAGLNEERVLDAMILVTIACLVFARAGYILANPGVFGQDVGKWLLLVRYPGMSYVGAILGGVITLGILGKLGKLDKRFDVLETGDIFTLPVIFVSILGYIGAGVWWVAGLYGLLFLGLRLLERRIGRVPEMAEMFKQSGFFVASFLLVASLTNAVLAKSTGGALYYSWVIVGCLVLGLTLARFNKLTKAMIQFPANVLEQIKKYLEDRKAQTEHRLADLKKEDPFEDKGRLLERAADDDEAHSKANHERTQALMNQMNAILIETRKALTKIKIGNYGTCEKCGKMIDTDRLAAIPTATLCLGCEKKKGK